MKTYLTLKELNQINKLIRDARNLIDNKQADKKLAKAQGILLDSFYGN